MKRVLITGMCGFFGSALYEHIMVNTDWFVVGIDRLGETTYNGFDRVKESKHFKEDRTKLLTYDLTQPIGSGLKKEIGDINIIFNVASSSHVDNSIKSPRTFIKNNIDLVITTLDLAREMPNLELYYHFSTDETYSTAPEGVFYKEGERHNPGNPYSSSKSAQEMICRAYANTFKLPIVISNCMNMIAEKQHPEKFLPKIIVKLLKGETIRVHTDNEGREGTRFYIHTRDVSSAVLHIVKNAKDRLHHIDASSGVYNIPGCREVSNGELVEIVGRVMGITPKVRRVSMDEDRPGVDIRYALDGTKLKNIGWEPPKDLEEKIRRIVEWSLRPENKKWLNI